MWRGFKYFQYFQHYLKQMAELDLKIILKQNTKIPAIFCRERDLAEREVQVETDLLCNFGFGCPERSQPWSSDPDNTQAHR